MRRTAHCHSVKRAVAFCSGLAMRICLRPIVRQGENKRISRPKWKYGICSSTELTPWVVYSPKLNFADSPQPFLAPVLSESLT